MLWDCPNCGTKQIAASLDSCPVCWEPQPTEKNVPADAEVETSGGDGAGIGAASPDSSDPPVPGEPDAPAPQAPEGASEEDPSKGGFTVGDGWES